MTMNWNLGRTEDATSFDGTTLVILIPPGTAPPYTAPFVREVTDILDLVEHGHLASGGSANEVFVLNSSTDEDWVKLTADYLADELARRVPPDPDGQTDGYAIFVQNGAWVVRALPNADTTRRGVIQISGSFNEGSTDNVQAVTPRSLNERVDGRILGGNLASFANMNVRTDGNGHLTVGPLASGGGSPPDGVVTGISYDAATRKLTLTRSVGGAVIQSDTIDVVTTTVDGLMAAADKEKLNNLNVRDILTPLQAGGNVSIRFTRPNGTTVAHGIPTANSSNAGAMSAADKTRLDGIEEIIRDTIFAALRGVGGINITENDAANTITISYQASAAQTHTIYVALKATSAFVAAD